MKKKVSVKFFVEIYKTFMFMMNICIYIYTQIKKLMDEENRIKKNIVYLYIYKDIY